MRARKIISKLINEIKKMKNKRIKFVFIFGSVLTSKFNKLSDIDVCIYYDADKRERFNFLIELGRNFSEYDTHIFQDLPLYVRKEVLKGKLIYCQDVQFVYDVAYQTLQEWGFFKKGYYDYIQRKGIKIET